MDSYEDRLRPAAGDSSYVRIYKLLMKTPKGLEIRRRVEGAFNSLTFHRHEFVLSGTSAVLLFRFRLGRHEWNATESHEISEGRLDSEFVVDAAELNGIAQQYLGKSKRETEHAVPTFNCSMDTVLGIKKTAFKKGREVTVKPKNDALPFARWAEDFLNSTPLRETNVKRMRAEMRAVTDSPETPGLRHAALLNLARADLKQVLVKWQCLSAADLQEAWDMALATGIMEA